MITINRKSLYFCASAVMFLSSNLYSQTASVSVNQDPQFEQLLNEKRRINSSITVNNRYKIQIFTGDSESSKKVLADFRRDFRNYDATIVFSTPSYKVWIGNFKTRIEAERHLSQLMGRYPSAFLIKPNK